MEMSSSNPVRGDKVDYYPVSHQDSETHAGQNGNLERHEVSKIEDRVQCQICLRYQRPGETYCGCGRMLLGITDEVKTQAEQRLSSRYIMYVPDIYDLVLKSYPKEPTPWKI